MSLTTNETEAHWEKFRKFEREGNSPAWLQPARQAGMTRFAELGFPTTRDEDWRFTSVAPIARLPFRPVLAPAAVGGGDLATLAFGGMEAVRLVFIDGHFDAGRSSLPALPAGVVAGSLASALPGASAALREVITAVPGPLPGAFPALNSAFFQDGGLILVPAGVSLDLPVHLVFLSSGAETGLTAHPRNLVVLEAGARATVLESYASLGVAATLTNAVTELVLGEGALLEHIKFQDESHGSYHVAAINSRLAKASTLVSHSIAAGARLSRNNLRTFLGGEGAECILNGLYLTHGDRLADHHMVVEHASPRCNSHEYFNGILDGRSKGVFHGRIHVHRVAQKTDAKQTNKNLLLSDDATADTKPQLEIYADDVKCTHGATIGQLNDESIFYLRSRGIGVERARRMLIHAFAGEILDRVRCAAAREELSRIIWDRLEAEHQLAGTN